MLVLSRVVGQKIVIGDNITITINEIRGGRVKLGIVAPESVNIVREEVRTKELRAGLVNFGNKPSEPDSGAAVAACEPAVS